MRQHQGPGQRKRLESREGTVTTTVSLPGDLHHRLAMAALTLRWTLAEVLRVAAVEWLARHERKGKGGRR
jgi:hypothetical protein